jgi:hypothetical protein
MGGINLFYGDTRGFFPGLLNESTERFLPGRSAKPIRLRGSFWGWVISIPTLRSFFVFYPLSERRWGFLFSENESSRLPG